MLSLLAFFALTGLSSVHAQSVYSCNGLQAPDWDSCQRAFDAVDWNAGIGTPEGPYMVEAQGCLSITEPENAGNCEISACNFRKNGQPAPQNSFIGDAYYNLIKEYCAPNAGGESWNGELRIAVTNNPDFKPSVKKRAALGSVVITKMTVEEHKKLVEEAEAVNIEKLTDPSTGNLQTRQDVTYNLLGKKNSVKTDEHTQLSAATGSGASQTWTTTKGYSVGIQTSAEVGASLFEIFSASVSITTSYEKTESFSKALTFDPSGRCNANQRAVLYLYPLYNEYTGTFSDNPGEAVVISVPVAPPNNYEIVAECLG